MSCNSNCPPQCPCHFVHWLPRVAFGLILVGFGVNHYKNLGDFVDMSSGAFASVPALATIVGFLAYIVPALMIVGGALFAVRQLCCISKTCILASLSGIIGWASLAVLLGDGQAGMALMPAIQNAAILLILYTVVKKMGCCGGSCSTGATK